MKILFLTQWFQPENFFKGLPFAKALKEKGHEVEVLTGFPNYPGGNLYPGYRVRFYQRETFDGIAVHRVPLYPSHDRSALRRILNYMSFSLSAFLMGVGLVKKPDVIYIYNLVTLCPAAYLLRLRYGAKVIIDVQDLWPQSIASSGMMENPFILTCLNAICNRMYKKADQITVLSPGFKKHLVGRGIPSEKIEVIYNWCDEKSLSGATDRFKRRESEFPPKFVVLYAGAMGTVQGLETVLGCAEMCQKEMPDIQFVLIGDGADRDRLQRKAETRHLGNVTFLPRRSPQAMAEVYELADALLVHLQDEPLFRITIPSKTQAYLYMGKPLIMAMAGDAAELVRRAEAGVICKPGNPRAMMEAIKTLRGLDKERRDDMGKAGRRFYMEHLSFEQGVRKFEHLMLSMTRRSS